MTFTTLRASILMAVITAVFLFPSCTLAVYTRSLSMGSSGTDVSSLQSFLKTKGLYHADPTGYFDYSTQRALMAYQSSLGFEAVGVLGPKTRAVLNASLTPSASSDVAEKIRVIVTAIQKILQTSGFPTLQATGIYDTATQEALRVFASSLPVSSVTTTQTTTPVVTSGGTNTSSSGGGTTTTTPTPPVDPTPATPLRTIAVQNRLFRGAETESNLTAQVFRFPVVIGTDSSDIVLSFMNWYMDIRTEGMPANTITVSNVALEKDSGVVRPIYFGSSRSLVLAPGATDIQSTALAASAFGQTSFAKGDLYWVRGKITVPAGGTIPYSARITTDVPGSQVLWYNPSETTVSVTDSTGPFTQNGTSARARTQGYAPIVLGHPLVDGPSYIAIGDSITEQIGDSSGGSYGRGYFQRALRDMGGYPNINLARSGSLSTTYALSSRWRSYAQYARFAVEGHGTNDLGGAESGDVLAIEQAITTNWNTLRSAGVEKIIRMKLLPRSSSTDNWTTLANQSPAPRFRADEQSEQLNTWFDTKVADGTLYGSFGTSVRSTTVPQKWRTASPETTAYYTGADGIHPSIQGHTFLAAELAAIISGLH